MSNPAGWYPQPDGQQQYWDGEQWTEEIAPGVLPVTPPVAAQRNWFLRHKAITGVVTVVLLMVFAGIAYGVGSRSDSVASVSDPTAIATTPSQAALDKAAADQAVADKATADKATADKAAADQAVADKATANRAAAQKTAAQKSAATNAAAQKAAAPPLAKTVRDGKFAFTVTTVKCGLIQVGEGTNEFLIQRAQGQYCRVAITVENIGDKAQRMFESNQYLFDANGRKFTPDSLAGSYDDSAKLMFEEIKPGSSIKGTMYFDVPEGTSVRKLELHDSVSSGGVTVLL
ncbi:MAG: DUF4352 domain-containing protein [Actinomycetota bacterium]